MEWAQLGYFACSVRCLQVPARLNRSVDIDLVGPTTTTTVTEVPVGVPVAAQPTIITSRSFLGRASSLSCRVLLLDGDEITVEVEVTRDDWTCTGVLYRARQLYKNISMLFLFPV